jgi:hypothetical protein
MIGVSMEENYKLEKEFKLPADTFREAYREFQKKFIYPKSRVYVILFSVLAVGILIFGIIAMSDASNKRKYITYIAFIMAAAFAFKEWYTPEKMRRNLTESVRSLGEPVYKIGVGDKYVDISTVSEDLSNVPEEERENVQNEDPLPEKTRLKVDDTFQLMEYDKFFLMLSGKESFYILPKDGFSESELEIVRGTVK